MAQLKRPTRPSDPRRIMCDPAQRHTLTHDLYSHTHETVTYSRIYAPTVRAYRGRRIVAWGRFPVGVIVHNSREW